MLYLPLIVDCAFFKLPQVWRVRDLGSGFWRRSIQIWTFRKYLKCKIGSLDFSEEC